jgi:excisionase family DNA binding protein
VTTLHLVPRLPSRSEPERAVYSVKEVAQLLGLNLGGTYALVKDGTIPARRVGSRWLISKQRFHAWLDGLADDSEPEEPPPVSARRVPAPVEIRTGKAWR